MDLPIGYQAFHNQKFFNYQMNRLHALGFARAEDIRRAAAGIRTRVDYVRCFEGEADAAVREGRSKNAAAYLRAAEFFAPHGSPQKDELYFRFRETFYEAFSDEGILRCEVPYAGSYLPAQELRPPDGAPARGTVLFFGGFDSLIEEFFVIWKYFARAGFRVIAFEGPGQGGVIRMYGHRFDHDWEKPVGAILDHFEVDSAALVGISMGGYWAVRAAAYEPRIQQVVSWPPVYDWLEQIPGWTQALVRGMLKTEGFMNWTIRLRMRLFPILDHAMNQAMYMAGGETPMDGVRWLLGMNREHLSSGKVTQDVLLLGGEADSFQPVRLLHKQAAALANARSVTTQIFTRAEHAHMHCQMGNLDLALGAITDWLNPTAT
ncbi:MAG TPA: alpha/beta hydrolase [Anaerolineales bacterium]|nr:alpha/beta hydrolase [Anaerolineales bacterium]